MSTAAVDDLRVDAARERRNRTVRAVGLVVLGLFVAAGAVGTFGVRSEVSAATGSEGTRVTVSHASVARPGLAVPLEIVVERPGGFDAPVEVAVSTDYLRAHDHNGFQPQPSKASADATWTRWTYDPPPGDTLAVWVDHRIEPGVQWRRDGTVRVAVAEEAVVVEFTTWVLP